jgi:hypothetical protein
MIARKALLSACLALPSLACAGSALGQPLNGVRTIMVPPGSVVLVLPGFGGMPAPWSTTNANTPGLGDPLVRMIAEPDAMMHELAAEMNAAFAQPLIPAAIDRQMNEMLEAAMRGAPPANGGSTMVFTSVTSGAGTCSEQVAYTYPGDGGKPRVSVSRTGSACGALESNGPVTVKQHVAPPSLRQPTLQPAPRLWTVGDPPREVSPGGVPHT